MKYKFENDAVRSSAILVVCTVVPSGAKGARSDTPVRSIVVFSMTFVASLVFTLTSAVLLFLFSSASAQKALGSIYYPVIAMSVSGLTVSLVLAFLSGFWLRRSLAETATLPSSSGVPHEGGGDTGTVDSPSALSHLDDAENEIYRLIVERGGSMLQKDLVGLKKYSKAKVTRAIDHLERAELVERLRHGTTNMIVLREKRVR